MEIGIEPNYDKLQSVFTDKFLKLSNESFGNVTADLRNMFDKSGLTNGITELISTKSLKELTPQGYDDVAKSAKVTGKHTKEVLKVVLAVNDILTKVNTVVDFNSTMSKLVFKGYGSNIRRSSQTKNGYQGLTPEERAIVHMYVFCDLIINHDAGLLSEFVDRVNRLCGRHSIYDILHGLCHDAGVDDELRACASDLYVVVSMMSNLTHDGVINDGYISKYVCQGHCDQCKIAPWINPNVWALIVQNGIYMKRASDGNTVDVDLHNNFVKNNGGNLINMLGLMYIGKKDFKLLYCVGIVFGLLAPETFDVVGDDFTVSTLSLQVSNGVISIVRKVGEEYTADVVEQQSDGYVVYSLDSTQPMNFDKVKYYSDNYKAITGGEIQAPDTIKFSENQMATAGEWISLAICAFLVYLIITSILSSMRQQKQFKSRINVPNKVLEEKSDDKAKARVEGAMNPNIPDVETFVTW